MKILCKQDCIKKKYEFRCPKCGKVLFRTIDCRPRENGLTMTFCPHCGCNYCIKVNTYIEIEMCGDGSPSGDFARWKAASNNRAECCGMGRRTPRRSLGGCLSKENCQVRTML